VLRLLLDCHVDPGHVRVQVAGVEVLPQEEEVTLSPSQASQALDYLALLVLGRVRTTFLPKASGNSPLVMRFGSLNAHV
jgi:hypothetical protein